MTEVDFYFTVTMCDLTLTLNFAKKLPPAQYRRCNMPLRPLCVILVSI